MSGGGASTINIPSFLALGIPLPLASSMQKVASVFWVIPSGLRYLKGKKIDWILLGMLSIIGMVGVYFGVNTILTLPKRSFEILIGVVILILIIYSFIQKSFGEEKIVDTQKTGFAKIIFAPASFFFGFYEGFFGAGNGIFFTTFINKLRGYGLKESLGYYFLASWLWNVYASYLFIRKGYFVFGLMIAIILGSFMGAMLGSWYASRKSNTYVKRIFQIMGTVLAIKLLIGI
jgi:uncharacterized membrane protein YfcA